MTTIFSKYSRLLPEESDVPPPPQISGLNDWDVDLINKIKAAITKLKSTKQRSNQLKFKTVEFPRSVCDKNCNVNQDAIYCTQCELWVHRKCNGTSKQEYAKLSNEADDAPFQCLLCIIKEKLWDSSFLLFRHTRASWFKWYWSPITAKTFRITWIKV